MCGVNHCPVTRDVRFEVPFAIKSDDAGVQVFTVGARPMYDQPYEPCVKRAEVAQSVMALSYPGILSVTLRPGVGREIAEAIADCLRSLPGEELEVHIGQVEWNDRLSLDE